uniref:Uncharacterized protein n=1 Tax=Arundo donax TaxID=35708 RepID=A0A0A9H2G8_ARUDO
MSMVMVVSLPAV